MTSDSKNALKLAAVIGALVLALIGGLILVIPDVLGGISAFFEPGLGIRDAAKYSFLLTTVMVILFSLAAGDGLLGEIQFMLSGFFTLFFFNTLLLALLF